MSLTPIVLFNSILSGFFALFFFYQLVYVLVVFLKKERCLSPAAQQHRYAFLICAHNEAIVIENLIRSIKNQDYPSELIDIYVIADHCTDKTVELAQKAGACVYEFWEDVRRDGKTHGKSWVMDYGIRTILAERPDDYDGFFVFDADNVLDVHYVTEMNKAFDSGYDCVTSYRNSKNFGASWISAGYATWFMREAKYLNNARMICKTNCAISGTGYLLSAAIIKQFGCWPFRLLTEDIEFTAWAALNNIKIGYAQRAIFYDEQPVTFAASWRQRMRWTKGFYQVFARYGWGLFKVAVFKQVFAGYDILMTIAPAAILTTLLVIVNTLFIICGLIFPHSAFGSEMSVAGQTIWATLSGVYTLFFCLGLLTTITEFKQIYGASMARIIGNLFTFPIFMMSYIPIAIVALFKHVEWVPTEHSVSKSLEEIVRKH